MNEEKLRKEIKVAASSKVLYLSHCCLASLPKLLIQQSNDYLCSIRIFDLSYNNLHALSDKIAMLSNLTELWLSNNKQLKHLPNTISTLPKLSVIDIRNTGIIELPPSLCILTNTIYEIDWRETPLESHLHTSHSIKANELDKLMTLLYNIYTRNNLKTKLFDFLSEEHLAKESEKPHIIIFVQELVVKLSDMFDNLSDFKHFVSRCGSLLPDKSDDITEASLVKAKESFYETRRAVTMKRLAAEVEIKIRGFYFDRIERNQVEEAIASIYSAVTELADIECLIKYSRKIFPSEPSDLSGVRVLQGIRQVQAEIQAKKDAKRALQDQNN